LRILFFSPQQLWPVNSGSRLRNVHLATGLAQRAEVTVLQVLQPDQRNEATAADADVFEHFVNAQKEKSYSIQTVLKGVIGPLPVTVHNYYSSDIRNCLQKALHERTYDVVQMETSNLFSYIDVIRKAPGSPALLLDWHNIDSELMERYASESSSLPKKLIARRTATLLAKLEKRLTFQCDAHTVVSALDRDKLLAHNRRAAVTVIPNGVDSKKFSSEFKAGQKRDLLFVGSMDYHANSDAVLWFVNNIWGAIEKAFPDLNFTIVGRSPAKEIRDLATDRIRVTGTVEDVRPFYEQALAVIVPLRVGGGTRLKILEAMAMGVPVISTTIGAEGIEAQNGEEILLADSVEEMISALRVVMSNGGARREAVAQAGRRLVAAKYDWDSIAARLYQVHSELAERRAGTI
jgi:polysaccharide biosynthesis protein PslH